MSAPLELVIFDCDGVLVDSERIAVRVDVEMLGRLGWRIEVPTCVASSGRHEKIRYTRYGVEAARAAGMRGFGYAGGLTPRERLEGPGTVVFDDMRDLPRLLLES